MGRCLYLYGFNIGVRGTVYIILGRNWRSGIVTWYE